MDKKKVYMANQILRMRALNCFEKLPLSELVTYMFACKQRKRHANCKELLTRILNFCFFTHPFSDFYSGSFFLD